MHFPWIVGGLHEVNGISLSTRWQSARWRSSDTVWPSTSPSIGRNHFAEAHAAHVDSGLGLSGC